MPAAQQKHANAYLIARFIAARTFIQIVVSWLVINSHWLVTVLVALALGVLK